MVSGASSYQKILQLLLFENQNLDLALNSVIFDWKKISL